VCVQTNSSMTSSCEEHLSKNECPCCGVARTGHVNPRRALQEHIRRFAKKDAAHKMWADEHWATFFKRGGDRTPVKVVTAEDIISSVKCTFGEEWSERVTITD